MDQSVCMLSITAIAGCTSNTFDFLFRWFLSLTIVVLPRLFLSFFGTDCRLHRRRCTYSIIGSIIGEHCRAANNKLVQCAYSPEPGVGTVAGNHLRECVRASCQLVIKDRQLSTLLTAIRVQFVKQNYWFLILHSYLLFCAG